MDGLLRIRTPLLYPDGDVIDLFVQSGTQVHVLTDAGETMRWLRTQSLGGKLTDKQRKTVQDVCLTHNVEMFQGELFVSLDGSVELVDAVMRLSQACSRVADLWFTFRFYASRELVDDVAEFLDERSIRYERNVKSFGRSGTPWRTDFNTRTDEAAAMVMVLTTGARSASSRIVEHTAAAWYDLGNMRLNQANLKFVSLFDDTIDVWSDEDFRLLEPISEIAFWSRPAEFVNALHTCPANLTSM